jgi:hypothetical protein
MRPRVPAILLAHNLVAACAPAEAVEPRRRLEPPGRQFVFRYRPDYDLGVAPGWLLALPVE